MRLVTLCILLVTLLMPEPVWMNQYLQICRLLKDGTLIRNPGTCNEYIACENGLGEIKTCKSPNSFFEPSKQACAETASSATIKYCGNRCDKLDNTWVSHPKSCQQFFYCVDGAPWLGECENGRHFEEKSQMCIYDVDSQCIDVGNICEILPDRATFRNEMDCATYYECRNGAHSLKKCSSSTYFNIETGKCSDKTLLTCDTHLGSGVCKTRRKVLKGFVSDGATCRGYFFCRDLGSVADIDPIWGQCPEGMFFNPDNQSCGEPTSIVCKFNRCESRGSMMVTSSSNDCHNYITCQNGFPVSEKTCQFDMFFNERTQSCSHQMIFDICCDGQK